MAYLSSQVFDLTGFSRRLKQGDGSDSSRSQSVQHGQGANRYLFTQASSIKRELNRRFRGAIVLPFGELGRDGIRRIDDGTQPLGSESHSSDGGVVHGADSPMQATNLQQPAYVDPWCGGCTNC